MLIGRKSTLFDFLRRGPIVIMVHVQLELNNSIRKNIIVHVNRLIHIILLCLSFFLLFPHNTIMPAMIHSDVW